VSSQITEGDVVRVQDIQTDKPAPMATAER